MLSRVVVINRCDISTNCKSRYTYQVFFILYLLEDEIKRKTGSKQPTNKDASLMGPL